MKKRPKLLRTSVSQLFGLLLPLLVLPNDGAKLAGDSSNSRSLDGRDPPDDLTELGELEGSPADGGQLLVSADPELEVVDGVEDVDSIGQSDTSSKVSGDLAEPVLQPEDSEEPCSEVRPASADASQGLLAVHAAELGALEGSPTDGGQLLVSSEPEMEVVDGVEDADLVGQLDNTSTASIDSGEPAPQVEDSEARPASAAASQGFLAVRAEGASQDPAGGKAVEDALSYIQSQLLKAQRDDVSVHKRLAEALRWGNSMKQELEKTKRQLAKAQQDAAGRASHASALEARLNESRAALTERGTALGRVRQQLSAGRRDLDEKAKAWQASRAQMQRNISEESRQILARDATIRSLVAEKAAAEKEHEAASRRTSEDLHKANDEVAKMKAVALQTNRLLKQEHARSKTLRELAEANKRKVLEYAGVEKQLRRELTSADSFSHNLTLQLQETYRRQRGMLSDRESLLRELQGNTSKAASLSAQVAQLRRRLEEEQNARSKAEATKKQAESEKGAAQAIAKQLSSTVPQLLEQAKLAHEARDAEKALRAQAQTEAKQKIQDLEQQYNSVVQSQLNQLQSTAVKAAALGPGTAAAPTAAGNEDATLALENGKVAETPASDYQTEGQTGETPNLAGDSDGLGELLSGSAELSNSAAGDGSLADPAAGDGNSQQ